MLEESSIDRKLVPFPANSMLRLINAVQGLMKRLLNKLSPRRLI